MNPTQPYWTPEPWTQTTRFNKKQLANTLGFTIGLPWPEVTTAGQYFGENPVYGRRELVYRSDAEYFARQNIIPSVAGIPSINPYDRIYKFSREKYTVRV
jgi:hypothetical protein